MKKKITLVTLLLHLIVCIFFSFGWKFLEGIYLGFGLTFIVLYLLTLPAVVGGLSLGYAVYGLAKKQTAVIDLICGGVGLVMLSAYVLSATGVFGGSSLSQGVYAALPFGVLAILSLNLGKYIYLNIKNKK